MKLTFAFILICISSVADYTYQSGKIDMHGGNYDNAYEMKNSFASKGMGLSSFLDSNSSKKLKPITKIKKD